MSAKTIYERIARILLLVLLEQSVQFSHSFVRLSSEKTFFKKFSFLFSLSLVRSLILAKAINFRFDFIEPISYSKWEKAEVSKNKSTVSACSLFSKAL